MRGSTGSSAIDHQPPSTFCRPRGDANSRLAFSLSFNRDRRLVSRRRVFPDSRRRGLSFRPGDRWKAFASRARVLGLAGHRWTARDRGLGRSGGVIQDRADRRASPCAALFVRQRLRCRNMRLNPPFELRQPVW